MSAGDTLVTAAMASLHAEDVLDVLTVFDAPPTRGFFPYAVVGEPVLHAVDAAGVTGRAGTLIVTYRDGGERPLALRLLMAVAEETVAALPADIGDGWRLAGIALASSRLDRTKDGWTGRSAWSVRLFRMN